MNNEWLKLKQAALFLNIPEITLRRWVKTGRIKHIMTAGRQYRFHIDDLKAFQARYPMYSKPGSTEEAAKRVRYLNGGEEN